MKSLISGRRIIYLLLYLTVFTLLIFYVFKHDTVQAVPGNIPEGLFTSMNTPGASHANEASIRARTVKINEYLLNSESINLNLFSDEQYIAKRKHVRRDSKFGLTWTGDIEGIDQGSVNITLYKGAVAGSVNLPGKLFEIHTRKNGKVVVQELESANLPEDGDPFSPSADVYSGDQPGGSGSSSPGTATESGDIIDLLVVYTPSSRIRYGQSGIESLIINAVAMANDAYSRSNFTARLNLVHMQEVNYSETGDMRDALYGITYKTDGIIDNVHDLRDQYGADIVSLITQDSNFCGIAWIMTSTYLNYFEPYAFNVTYSSCISNHSMTHEIGHNEGNAHDRDNAGDAAYDYSYGYRNPGANFRTIMSYSCSDIGGSCPRVPHLSNPNILYNGYPTGIDHNSDPSNSADNIRSMNNTFPIVSNWRTSVIEENVPDAPGNLATGNVTESTVDLTWSDLSNDEDGFYVERSLNNNSWSQIATLGSNTTNFQDTGLNSDTSYYYRIQAFNSVGNSDYSNTVNATTDSPPAPANNPPEFFNDPFSRPDANSGTAYSDDIADSAYDPDGDAISYSKLSGPNWLIVSSNGNVSGTPGDNHAGLNSFEIEVIDSEGLTDTATLNIEVNLQQSNNPPEFLNDPFTESDAEAGSSYSADISDSAFDPDGDAITYSKVSGPGWLVVSSNGSLSGTPGDNNAGLNSFQVQVQDSGGLSDTATLNINVDSQPQVQNTVHVGDLDYVSGNNKNRWEAIVTITVHDSEENPVSGVFVSGQMSTKGRSPSCTTGSSGKCQVSLNGSNKDNSITFGVTELSGSGYNYSASENHDPDGDSNGTTIVTYQP